jgi:hypothetical protein
MEAFLDLDLHKIVPVKGFDAMRKALPWVQTRYTSYGAYSQASVEDILGERFAACGCLEANTLETMVLLNRGDYFEVKALPIEAQFAPAFGICVADFDGNGTEDLFLSQNFYGTDAETPRYDAGRGLLLLGDGHGSFATVPGQTSGIQVYGEQRGAAACDYDGDGRTDLVVTQNGNTTKLYHNETARPGLRVTLIGPAGNPTAIGAQLRLRYRNSEGPVREIHAGSGYWSQDAATQVLGRKESSASLWVRWPGGKTAIYEIPDEAREATVDISGRTKTK